MGNLHTYGCDTCDKRVDVDMRIAAALIEHLKTSEMAVKPGDDFITKTEMIHLRGLECCRCRRGFKNKTYDDLTRVG